MISVFQSNSEYSDFLKRNLSEIKDLTKWVRQIYLKKLTPKSFCQIYDNLDIVKEIFHFICNQEKKWINKIDNENIDKEQKNHLFIDYLISKEKSTREIADYCDKIRDFIFKHIDLNVAKETDCLQGFETNFIKSDIDKELDEKKELLEYSNAKLESIRDYLNNLIADQEKKVKSKSTDYIKIYETEKNNFSMITTTRRCKLLEDALPSTDIIVPLKFNLKNRNHNSSEKVFDFDFVVSKKRFEFHKQS
jgi:DNA mismatch repair ATPase MutS